MSATETSAINSIKTRNATGGRSATRSAAWPKGLRSLRDRPLLMTAGRPRRRFDRSEHVGDRRRTELEQAGIGTAQIDDDVNGRGDSQSAERKRDIGHKMTLRQEAVGAK